MNLDPQRESLKIIKNSKGYTWEIKIMANLEKLDSPDVDRVSIIDEWLRIKFNKYKEV